MGADVVRLREELKVDPVAAIEARRARSEFASGSGVHREKYIENDAYQKAMETSSSASEGSDSKRFYYFQLGRVISAEEAPSLRGFFPEGTLYNDNKEFRDGFCGFELLSGAAFQGNEKAFALMLTFSREVFYFAWSAASKDILRALIPFDRYSCFKIYLAKMEDNLSFERDYLSMIDFYGAFEGSDPEALPQHPQREEHSQRPP